MHQRWSRLLVLAGILLSMAASPVASSGRAAEGGFPAAAPAGREFASGTILVRFREVTAASAQEQLLARHGATYDHTIYGSDVQVLRVPEGRELEISAALSREPGVAYAEPDYISSAFLTPNDPSLSKQWAHTEIMQSEAAWGITTGSTTIVIAVIDTGVDETHPDLQGKLTAGHSFLNRGNEDSNPHDLNGHGTHVSGIAAAATNNGIGVAGMSWGAQIMPVRVLGADGLGYNSDIAAGINWATEHGADIINLSLGGDESDQVVRGAVSDAYAAGVLVIASMGNYGTTGTSTPYYPAAYDNVFAVAATDRDDTKANYSNYGSHCDIAAPGGEMTFYHDPDGIYSTMPTYDVYLKTTYGYYLNYDYLQGTSQAAPYVSGLAALVWSLQPTLSQDDVQQLIESTAVDVGTSGWDIYTGWGRVDALRAVRAALGIPETPLLNPIANADKDGSYLVDWELAARATEYLLQEDDNAAFTSPAQRYLGAATELNVTHQAAGIYYYRVRASSAAGVSEWSATQSTGVVPAAPTLAPIDNPTEADAYELSWTAVTGAAGYVLQEDDALDFTSPITRYAGTSLSYSVTGQAGGVWAYRVYATNSVGSSPASNTVSTTVAASVLAAPTLNPIDNADRDGDYTLSWSTVVSATRYTLEESDDPYFFSPTVVYSGTATSLAVNGQDGGVWSYRVRAHSASASSPWSETQAVQVTAYLRLPLVLRTYDPSVQFTWVPNGDFESGNTVWTSYLKQDRALIVEDSALPVSPHGGSWAAWLGGANNEIAYLEQSVTVPSASPELTYWYWISSGDKCDQYFDWAEVRFNGTALRTYQLCTSSDTGGWIQGIIDVAAYAGQTVTLHLRVSTDGTLPSSFFLDDIIWKSSSEAAGLAGP